MFCRNCGAEMSDTARFCPKCGTERINGRNSTKYRPTTNTKNC